MAELIEEQRENLTALNEPETVEVSLKDYEQLDNLPKLNGETILGNMVVSETVEIASGTTSSKYTPMELVTFRNNKRVLTYMGYPIIAEGTYGTGENQKFYFTYCENGSDSTMQTTFWRKYVDTSKAITTLARTNLPLGVNGKTWASPSATEITLTADDIKAENGYTPSDDKDLATKKYVDDSINVRLPDGNAVGDTLVWDGTAWVIQPAT